MLQSCEVSSPERFIRAPIIKSFHPENPSFDVLVGDTVAFAIEAIDPDENALRISFTIGDSLAASGSSWMYVVGDTGDVDITGCVANQSRQSTVEWHLRRTTPENQPPVILEVQPTSANPKTIIGSSVDFSMTAMDPEGQPLSYIFTVDDSLVSGSNHYSLQATAVGDFVVKSIVSDGDRFAQHQWTLSVFGEPDSIPPAPVTLASLETGQETGELVVEWIAVGDDDMDGLPVEYVVKTSGLPIVDETSWSQASDRPGEPPPATAGEIQRMVIDALNPMDLVYVGVRARDDFGNMSPIGDVLSGIVKGNDLYGVVRDAVTGAPVPDIRVRLISSTDTTDVDGRFVYHDLPAGAGPIVVWDEDDPGSYGDYFDIISNSYEIVDEDQVELWVIPNLPLQATAYESLLDMVLGMTVEGGPYGHLLRNWDEPIDVYVTPFVNNGLDYEQVIKGALLQWEDLVGMGLFRFVDQVPLFGFYVTYDPSNDRDWYQIVEHDERLLTILGKITMRTIYDPSIEGLMHTIASHEIGHALGMGHSADQQHLMVGGVTPVVNQPTPDEVLLGRVMYNLPRAQSMFWFQFD